MQDFKHLYGKEEPISKWCMLWEGIVFAAFLFAAFAFVLALSTLN